MEGPVQVFAVFQGPRGVFDDCAVGHGAVEPIIPTVAVKAEHVVAVGAHILGEEPPYVEGVGHSSHPSRVSKASCPR